MSRYAKFCTQCGKALSGEVRFCTGCGAAVAEIVDPAPVPQAVAPPVAPVAPSVVPPYVPPYVPPVVPSGPTGGRVSTRTIGFVVGAALLLVAAGFGVKAVVGGDDNDAAAASDRATAAQGSDAADGDGDGVLGDQEADVEDPVAETEDFECWNGDLKSSQDLCPGLRGSTAMKWLLPSFERDDGYGLCSPANTYDKLTGVNKEVARGCDIRLSDGSNARIVYSQWPYFEVGLEHYQLKYGPADYQRFNGQVNGWNADRRPNGRFQGSQMFAAIFPYSVTVDANSPDNVREGFGYVEFRSESETLGYDSD